MCIRDRSKGNKSQTDPNNPKYKPDAKYKPVKASGLTKGEQQSLKRRGEKKLRDLRLAATGKKKESELKHPITHKEIARRKKDNK